MTEPKSLEELRPAEEIARDMVTDVVSVAPYTVHLQDIDFTDWVALEPQLSEADAADVARDAQGILSRLIDRERKAAFEAGRRSVEAERGT